MLSPPPPPLLPPRAIGPRGDQAAALWSRGSYAVVGDWFSAASRQALTGVDLEGRRLLDVACGTGAVAVEAARRGARVTGLDVTPALLSEAAARARAAEVEVRWVRGTFEDLSGLPDHDVVTSAFGVMFAVDPPTVLRELLSAARPGGLVSVVTWEPQGVFGRLPSALVDLLPALADLPDSSCWTSSSGLAALAADAGGEARPLDVSTGSFGLPFASVPAAADALLRWSGGWMALFDALESTGAASAGRVALEEHLAAFASPGPEEGVVVQAAFAVAHLLRG